MCFNDFYNVFTPLNCSDFVRLECVLHRSMEADGMAPYTWVKGTMKADVFARCCPLVVLHYRK